MNKIIINRDYSIIILNRRDGDNLECIIDTDDLDLIKSFGTTWYAGWNSKIKNFYVRTNIRTEDGKKTTLYLHRVIMNAQEGEYVDHINHNSLYNRKENLRLTTNKQNSQHRISSNPNSKTGIRNVSYDKKKNEYYIQLFIDGKNRQFRGFKTLDEASIEAENLRKKYY